MQDAAITVRELLDALGHGPYRVVAGHEGVDRPVRHRSVQRLGVALTGYTEHLVPDRLQLLGRSEGGYLASLDAERRAAVVDKVLAVGFPALVVTSGQAPSPELAFAAQANGVVLIRTDVESTEATDRINAILNLRLAPRETRHGALVDIYGIGVLLLGKSGIGKSELALELVASGHRLVADDLVQILQTSPRVVTGSCPELARHYLEIRGLGLLNAKDLFGAAAVRTRKRVELAVELVEWDPQVEYDRLGLDQETLTLAEVPVRKVTIPVRPGRSLRLVLEVAARNALLQGLGTHSARAFVQRQALALGHPATHELEEETAHE
jgi:HPr kinase/phosphorylase